MSDPTSIFDTNNTATLPNEPSNSSNVTPPVTSDPLADLLKDIKNEKGEPKYRDPLEALNGLKHAQEFIPQLKSQLTDKESEIVRLREEVSRLKEVESSVAQLTQQQSTSTPTASTGITEEQIAELVARTMTKKDAENTQKQNLATVVSTLQSVLGADAEKTFYAKAAEFGMSQEEINSLAATKPKAVLTMFGITGKEAPKGQPTASNAGGMNTAAFQPQQATFVGRNPKPALIGATQDDLKEATNRAKSMVEELQRNGLSINDLTNPKIYNKYFK
jgi:hypothetical protein